MGPAQRFRRPLCVALLALACACVPRTAPPRPLPAPPPPPPPAPAPAAPPAPAPPVAWQDAALAEGDWSYAGEEARFEGRGGALFALRCEAGRQIALRRPAAPAGPLTIVTSFGQREVAAPLAAADPLFDEIAFSRGRFLVRSADGGALVLPSWPEPARLIEECRG
jgi:hypothetical protein